MKTILILLISTLLTLAATPPWVGIAWDAPDPAELDLIAGYRAHWGTASGIYTDAVMLDHAADYTAKVGSLVAGETYFLAITAVGKNGVESDFSNEISFTIKATPQAPTGLRTVTITMETSQNLRDWEPVARMSRAMIEKEFFRVRVEEAPRPQ